MKKILLLLVITITSVAVNAQTEVNKNVVIPDSAIAKQYTCPMHPNIISDKTGTCPDCGMNLVEKKVEKAKYVCPMHPDVVSNKPGICSKCGMNLVEQKKNKKKMSCCSM